MIPPHSCAVPGQEPGHVDERDQRDVERVAGPHEPRCLLGRGDVEHAGERLRLVADDADAVAAEPREAADDVLREERLDLEELPVVDDRLDHLLDVVRPRRLVGHQRVELRRLTIGRVGRRVERAGLRVVLRQEAQQVARVVEHLLLVRGGQMRDARFRRVRHRAAELLERHLLARHRLHHIGPGDEHVRRALDHQDEVGDRRASRPHRPRTGPSRARSAGSRPRTGRCARRSRRSPRARRRPPGSARRPSR